MVQVPDEVKTWTSGDRETVWPPTVAPAAMASSPSMVTFFGV
jgi:hypothetical protein